MVFSNSQDKKLNEDQIYFLQLIVEFNINVPISKFISNLIWDWFFENCSEYSKSVKFGMLWLSFIKKVNNELSEEQKKKIIFNVNCLQTFVKKLILKYIDK